MAVNIYDVAKLSGVSIATVSRVVNGSTKVSEKPRRKGLDVLLLHSQWHFFKNVSISKNMTVFLDAVVMTWKRKRHIRKCYCRNGLMRLF